MVFGEGGKRTATPGCVLCTLESARGGNELTFRKAFF